MITKFDTSNHCLQIQTGHYKNIPRPQRLCSNCNVLEDEYHFFLFCKSNEQARNVLLLVVKMIFLYLKTCHP